MRARVRAFRKNILVLANNNAQCTQRARVIAAAAAATISLCVHGMFAWRSCAVDTLTCQHDKQATMTSVVVVVVEVVSMCWLCRGTEQF